MRLTLQLFASLRERAGGARFELDGLPDGLDVSGLKRELARRMPELGDLGHVRGVIGTDYVRDDAKLGDGDLVSLLPPVSGGAPGPDAPPDPDEDLARGVFELLATPLDLASAQRRVASPSCGAICAFAGTTRDSNRGREVLRLEYEAFEAMTGPEMARIFGRCRAALRSSEPERAVRMLCQHRVGVVPVGEPSVVIAVASPHRAVAFEACRFLIDELKASLPIWKKEHYRGGEHWIGERS
jgi:molybdopterin synthase catalytic subunit/molybdopterin converting factor small subunit